MSSYISVNRHTSLPTMLASHTNQVKYFWYNHKDVNKSELINELNNLLKNYPNIKHNSKFVEIVFKIQSNWKSINNTAHEYLNILLHQYGFMYKDAETIISGIFRLAQHSGIGKYFSNPKNTNSIDIFLESLDYFRNKEVIYKEKKENYSGFMAEGVPFGYGEIKGVGEVYTENGNTITKEEKQKISSHLRIGSYGGTYVQMPKQTEDVISMGCNSNRANQRSEYDNIHYDYIAP